jgi:uncharacterized membrane protein YagU involved in acid resistance
VIGLGLNWTNGNLGLGLLVLTVIISSVALNLSKVNLWWFKLLCVLLGSFFSLVIPAILFRFFGSDIQYFWHNAIAFIFGFLIWFILIEALREKQNMINKLK